MRREQRERLLLSAQNWLFVALLLAVAGLLAWLSTRYVYEADWTANNRNSLTEPSVKLLETLEQPVEITAWAREDQALRASIRDFVSRYQRVKPDVELQFRNPDTSPREVRELGITTDGTLVIEYGGRTEQVANPAEQPVTNALARLARQGGRKVIFLTGHGERSPDGQANFDLDTFGQELSNKGIETRILNLAKDPGIPGDTQLLVIAGPEVSYLPGEVRMVRDWVAEGGNLLWLAEPGGTAGLAPVAGALGVSFLPGVVVDPTTRVFGIQDPAYALVVDYPDHALTRGLSAVTLFPQATALQADAGEGWETTPVLRTVERTWTETGELTGELRFDENTKERAGPLTIGLAMSRTLGATGAGDDQDPGKAEAAKGTGGAPDTSKSGDSPGGAANPRKDSNPGKAKQTQRVLVVGDGDFLSNSFLGNGANLDLGVRMVNWLVGDERFIEIRPKAAPDTGLQLTNVESGAIAIGAMIALPLLLALTGGIIWWRRRRA